MEDEQSNKTRLALIEQYRHNTVDNTPVEQQKNEVELFFDNRLRCLSVSEVAAYSSLSTKTIERQIKKKMLWARKVGRRWVIPWSAYEAWLLRKEKP